MHTDTPPKRWTENVSLNRWIDEMKALCRPKSVHICDGSDAEFDQVAKLMIESGSLVSLNRHKRPGSYWCRSHPDDVARVEENTFICSKTKEEAGPTNNWFDPLEMKKKILPLFNGCMEGRVMYIVPYCMGPLKSPYSIVGVEATDSPYVVLNMKLMTRMGKSALGHLGPGTFVPGLHSVGVPLKEGENDVPWPCNPSNRYIVHFPDDRSIWSFGSGYGGNALLGKKCLALRIASVMGRDDGWLAEHMLILGITNPEGKKKYIAASFPSACGKTNLAMLTPTLPGWKIETVGDDIAWLHFGKDGRLYAINPEAGYFGVAPGTSEKTNPNAMRSIEKNTIFTNVALTSEKDVWWEGMTDEPPENLTSWKNEPWDPDGKKPAAYPNARFTVRAEQNPIYDKEAENPQGVPISAIIFGGRRGSVIPLVYEAFNWQHGTFLGAGVSSETTAAAKGDVGKLRHDPFSMLPFCGYNMGDYFAHWLEMGKRSTPEKLPKIYYVNWFQKDGKGNYIWPGFGENSRVLKWVFDRCSNKAKALKTPIGNIPEELDLSGLELDPSPLFKIDKKGWLQECDDLESYFERFGEKMPPELLEELSSLRKRLSES